MADRDAACHCGQLRLRVVGDPFAVSICHCLACQRRTGSACGIQAGFAAEQVHVDGRFGDYTRVSDEADRNEHVSIELSERCRSTAQGDSDFDPIRDDPAFAALTAAAARTRGAGDCGGTRPR